MKGDAFEAAGLRPEDFHQSPNALAPDYGRSRVSERLLLTGHSHQAWPDRGFEGQQQAWLDAAELVDEKWSRALERAERVREGWAELLDDPEGHITLTTNTHEGIVRFLSAAGLRDRPRLVTTDGEFHTIRRQLDRLAEEGIELVKVPALPADTLAERLADRVDGSVAAVFVSSVLYRTAHIVPGLEGVMEACRRAGALLLVDVYHALNAIPYSLRKEGLLDAYVVGGGYKYMQYGEGNCFLRTPAGCELRPVVTGWFAEFGALARGPKDDRVAYSDGPDRFAGATYDPTSHYRASEVLAYFRERRLTPELLRGVSRHQVGLLAERFDALDLSPALIHRDRGAGLERIAGFLALESPRAGEISAELRRRGVLTDHRDRTLRLGPAPYLSDDQLEDAVGLLGEVVGSLR